MKSHTEYLTCNIPARLDFLNITPKIHECVSCGLPFLVFPRNESTRATMPPVRNPAPQPIASLTSVMMLLLKGGRRRSPLTAPLIPQTRRAVPRPIAITAKFLASRLPTTGLISPQINSPTSRSPEKTAYRGPPFPYVVKNQPSTATPTAVALVAKSFVYFPSTDKLLTPQIGCDPKKG
jgi:hypothetical protein